MTARNEGEALPESYRREFTLPPFAAYEENEMPPFELEEPEYEAQNAPATISLDNLHLREIALARANEGFADDTPEQVVDRAKAYLAFLKGENA